MIRFVLLSSEYFQRFFLTFNTGSAIIYISPVCEILRFPYFLRTCGIISLRNYMFRLLFSLLQYPFCAFVHTSLQQYNDNDGIDSWIIIIRNLAKTNDSRLDDKSDFLPGCNNLKLRHYRLFLFIYYTCRTLTGCTVLKRKNIFIILRILAIRCTRAQYVLNDHVTTWIYILYECHNMYVRIFNN